jgi:hypothetical protein
MVIEHHFYYSGRFSGESKLLILIKLFIALNNIIRLTELIHKFVRNQLDWDESLILLNEIVETEEWMQHLEIDMLIYQLGIKKRA